MDFKWLRDYSDFVTMGLMLPAAILVGSLIGYWIDTKFHTQPWGVLIGFVLGVIAGFTNLIRDYERLQNKEDDDTTKD